MPTIHLSSGDFGGTVSPASVSSYDFTVTIDGLSTTHGTGSPAVLVTVDMVAAGSDYQVMLAGANVNALNLGSTAGVYVEKNALSTGFQVMANVAAGASIPSGPYSWTISVSGRLTDAAISTGADGVDAEPEDWTNDHYGTVTVTVDTAVDPGQALVTASFGTPAEANRHITLGGNDVASSTLANNCSPEWAPGNAGFTIVNNTTVTPGTYHLTYNVL